MSSSGAWYSLEMGDGKVEKFQPSKWEQKMAAPAFTQRVYDVMDYEVINQFDKRLGNAEDFYEEKSE